MGVLWSLYSSCLTFCKIFWFLLWTPYSGYNGSPFFSYLLILWIFACTFCFSASVNCATSLAFVTLRTFLKNLPLFPVFLLREPFQFSASTDISFLQMLFFLSLHSSFPYVCISYILTYFATLIHFSCNNCGCGIYQVVYTFYCCTVHFYNVKVLFTN